MPQGVRRETHAANPYVTRSRAKKIGLATIKDKLPPGQKTASTPPAPDLAVLSGCPRLATVSPQGRRRRSHAPRFCAHLRGCPGTPPTAGSPATDQDAASHQRLIRPPILPIERRLGRACHQPLRCPAHPPATRCWLFRTRGAVRGTSPVTSSTRGLLCRSSSRSSA